MHVAERVGGRRRLRREVGQRPHQDVVRLGDVHVPLLDGAQRAVVDHLLDRVRPVEHAEVAVPGQLLGRHLHDEDGRHLRLETVGLAALGRHQPREAGHVGARPVGRRLLLPVVVHDARLPRLIHRRLRGEHRVVRTALGAGPVGALVRHGDVDVGVAVCLDRGRHRAPGGRALGLGCALGRGPRACGRQSRSLVAGGIRHGRRSGRSGNDDDVARLAQSGAELVPTQQCADVECAEGAVLLPHAVALLLAPRLRTRVAGGPLGQGELFEEAFMVTPGLHGSRLKSYMKNR